MEINKVKGLCKEIIKFYDKEQKNKNIPKEMQENISNLRLQKILLFLYCYYWKELKKEIININFYAWTYGPVVKPLYNFLKDCGSNGIDIYRFQEFETPKYNKKIFQKILNHLSQFSTMRLVSASHDTEPWLKTPNSSVIDNELIKKWFEQDVPEIK
ncbi:Panacea domain-containing protein [Spiroplasma endosymbiont of Nebria brevicollis]|uniref:Panacea domain-containing protein n=1 Tax=Spiroplasma endosymbiont of Nebria brevicollis TaxID=3066284 RepID=UPI00313A96AD